MTKKLNFTPERLRLAECEPGKSRTYLYDAKTPDLLFCVTANGHKAFYLYHRVNGRPQRYKLGNFPKISVDVARTLAAKTNGDIANGIDPQAQRTRARGAMSLAELLTYYLDHYARAHKRTWHDDQEQFERYFGKGEADRKPEDPAAPFSTWRSRRVNTITDEDVQSLHSGIGKDHKYAANRVLALLSKMFNVAKLPNPAKGVKRFQEHKRERFLDAGELRRFYTALKAYPDPAIRDFFLVALLTGARRSNVQSMRWDEVNLQTSLWTIPHEKAKGKELLRVVLDPHVVMILNERLDNRCSDEAGEPDPWVFPSHGQTGHLVEPKAAWAKILTAADLKDLRIHDLRRTFGSWMAASGASLPMIGKAMGHKNVATTAIYARLNLDPVRGAVGQATAAMLRLESVAPVKALPEVAKSN